MQKNLLLVHLESLNYVNYKMNRRLFPNLYEIEKKSIFFERYFSTATSTLMVIGDLMYGGMEQYEECQNLDFVPDEYAYKSSLFDDLKKEGYYTGIFIYPEGGDREGAEKRHIAGFQNEMVLKRDYVEYLNELKKGMHKAPFALMACNYISNLALNKYADHNVFGFDATTWESGYRYLDQGVKDLMDLLEKQGMLDSTVIVFYGDHGDDYWTHGMHGGLTHAIEPNASLIHTPLFIWTNTISEGYCVNDLICTIDLRKLIIDLLNSEVGLDTIVHRVKNKYLISRNEYSAQPLRKESFNKAYSITDGKYLLMVTNNGLTLFDIEMDPECHNNFLRFFVIEKGLLMDSTEINMQYSFHFKYYWDIRNFRILRQHYYTLRERLYAKVLELYLAGKRSEKDMLNEMHFDKIDYTY